MNFDSSNLIDQTYDMIFIIDTNGTIKFVNQATVDNLFYSRNELLNMNLREILFEAEKFIEILDSIVSSTEAKGQSRIREKDIDLSIIKREIGYQDLILISNDTNLKLIIANFQARKIQKDGEEYYLLVFRDITDRKFLEQELFKLTENLKHEVDKKTVELQKKNKMLEKLATTDTLTDLYNMRKFRELLIKEHNKVLRLNKQEYIDSYVIVMIDIDFFKYYNDHYGHQVGDELIKLLGQTLKESVRSVDVVGRYGGDEFVILLPETTYTMAVKVCFRIREFVRKDIKLKKIVANVLGDSVKVDKKHKVTLSIGCAKYTKQKDVDHVINDADTALYYSKESGRDCVHMLYKKSNILVTEDNFLEDRFKE